MMPLLFIIILILVVCSVSLPGANKGIEFLLKPDFSKVNGNVFLSAMGQAFFSLSLGMGVSLYLCFLFQQRDQSDKNSFQCRNHRYAGGNPGRLYYFPSSFFCRHTA